MSDLQRDHLMGYLEAYNRGDWEALAAFVSPVYVHHSGGEALDLAGFIAGAQWFRRGLPDFTVEPEELNDDGDRITVRFVARGTHERSLLGEQPTSREVVLHGTTVYRFADGVIAEDWETTDEDELRRQIGATTGGNAPD